MQCQTSVDMMPDKCFEQLSSGLHCEADKTEQRCLEMVQFKFLFYRTPSFSHEEGKCAHSFQKVLQESALVLIGNIVTSALFTITINSIMYLWTTQKSSS